MKWQYYKETHAQGWSKAILEFLQTFVGDLQEWISNNWDALHGGSWSVPGIRSQSGNFMITLTLGSEPTEAKSNRMCGGRDNIQDRGRAILLPTITSSNE